MAAEEVHMTDPGEMQLPVVWPRAPHDGAARTIRHLAAAVLADVGTRKALQRCLARDVGQVEHKLPRRRAEDLLQKGPLVDALVPGPQVLRVEVDVQAAEPGQGGQAAAEVLPGVVARRDGDAGDVRLGLAVGPREVELGYEGFHAEADLYVADVAGGRVRAQEVPGHDDVGEAEGEGVLEGPDALGVPGMVLVVGYQGMEEGGIVNGQGDRRTTYHRLQIKRGEVGDAKLGRRRT